MSQRSLRLQALRHRDVVHRQCVKDTWAQLSPLARIIVPSFPFPSQSHPLKGVHSRLWNVSTQGSEVMLGPKLTPELNSALTIFLFSSTPNGLNGILL